MKKAIVLMLATFYLVITAGVIVNVHYCMGDLASINYGHEKDHACENCGMEQQDGCCHTEHKIIKSEDDHVPVKVSAVNDYWRAVAELNFHEIAQPSSRTSRLQYFHYAPPDDHRLNKIHLHNSVFRI